MRPPSAVWLAVLCLFPCAAWPSETLRIATFNTELHRKGPGLLLRDIRSGRDDQVVAVARVIAEAKPDILALQGIDWDHDYKAVDALAEVLSDAGVSYPHRISLQPNTGMATGLDMDGDGRLGGPGDAQGFGYYTGQGGMAVLSRHPFADVRDLSALLWQDLPDAFLPVDEDGTAYPSPEAQAIQRLSSTGHWVVPVTLPSGQILTLMPFHASPPVFDGPEDRNGRRNHDEIRLWQVLLDGALGAVPTAPFVVLGDANLDPLDGAGLKPAITALLGDPRLQDPRPASNGAAEAGSQGHLGKDALDTVDWPDPGRLRVDYVLPSADLTVVGSGVIWPPQDDPLRDDVLRASRHRLVWVDLLLD
jgi:endonuclease/exonuclease/phosphatase family metal-dependent hydrolase